LASYGELRRRVLQVASLVLAFVSGLACFRDLDPFDHGWAVIVRPGLRSDGASGRIDLPLAALRLLGGALVVSRHGESSFGGRYLLRWLDSRDFIAADRDGASPRAIRAFMAPVSASNIRSGSQV